MTGRAGDEEIGARVREFVEAGEVDDFRMLAFHATVGDIPGQLGVLLREIAHAHDGYEEARTQYGTTEGEANRLFAVLGEAMTLVEEDAGRGAAPPPPDDACSGGLTERQRQILSFVSHGYATSEIAATLHIAEDTVKTHIQRTLRTLQASDRAHAVRIGFEEGLLVPAAQRRPRVPKSVGGRGRKPQGGVS